MEEKSFVGNVGKFLPLFRAKKKFLFNIFYNIEPLSAYLQKSGVFVLGLYFQNRLVGAFLEETEVKITFTQMGMALDNVFPKNLNDLDEFVKKNKKTVEYYFLSPEHMEIFPCDEQTNSENKK